MDIRGGKRGSRIGLSSFIDAVRAPHFESFELSVLLKSLLMTLEPHLVSSEASHMFDK